MRQQREPQSFTVGADGAVSPPPSAEATSAPLLRMMRLGRAYAAERPTLTQVLADLGGSGYGLALAVLAMPNMLPSPGVPLSMFLGVPLLCMAVLLLNGTDRPQLPAWLGRRRISGALIGRALRWLAPRLRWWQRRWAGRPITTPSAALRPLVAAVTALMAVVLILPIPFGNTLPALAVVLLGAGVFLADRRALGAGIATAVAAVLFAAGAVAVTWYVVESAVG